MIHLEDLTEVELGELMRSMAAAITRVSFERGLHPKPSFTLLVWNDPRVAQYISNGQRSGMIAALRETADRLERREDVPRG